MLENEGNKYDVTSEAGNPESTVSPYDGDEQSELAYDKNFERILNQDEINSLLAPQAHDKSDKQGWRILVDSNKISYERLPMLEVVFDRLLRLLTTSLRNLTSDNVEVSILEMTSVRFGDYINQLHLPSIISIFKIDEWATSGLLTVDADFIYSIVDILLGGKRGSEINLIEDRPFTTIECNLVKRLVNLILADFTKSFEPVAPVVFRFERMETNPRFAAIVRPVNAVILTKIRIEMENKHGTFEFMIPYSSLEPAREQLLQMFMGERSGQESIWENHFSNELWDTKVTLDTILEQTEMNLNDVLTWKPGTQIILRAKPTSPIEVVCGDSKIFTGKLGQSNGYISVLVEDNHIKNKASL